MSTQFFSTNLIKTATITTTTENAQFPATNLTDDRRTKVYRSTTNSDSITFDFGSATLVNNVMLINDYTTNNMLSACTVKIGNDATFATTVQTGALTIDTTNGFSTITFSTTTPVRYLRLVMTSTLGFCEISKIFAGTPVVLGSEIDFALPLGFQILNKATVALNRYGQKFVDIINTQRIIKGSFKTLSKAELDGALSLIDYSNKSLPIWILFDAITTNPNRLSGCYYFTNAPNMSLDSSLYWSLPLEFAEAL